MEQKTYGVWEVRGSGSVFGAAQAWCKENGKPLEFDSENAAKTYAAELKAIGYEPESEAELSAILSRQRYRRSFQANKGDIEKHIMM